jgi:ribulose-phosphate 3-epimerase
VEAARHLHRTLARIRELGARPGVVLNPATPIGHLADALPLVDYVLVMSVNPGFGGQRFIPSALGKIEALRAEIGRRGLPAVIEVDGGVDEGNAADLVRAGADILVAGNAVFGRGNPADNTRALLSRMREGLG